VGSGRDVEQAERSLQDIEDDMSNRSTGLRHRRRAN
jgi:hypothetical protein